MDKTNSEDLEDNKKKEALRDKIKIPKSNKTYKITSTNTDKIYIGSTTVKLSRRLSDHVSQYKRFLAGKFNNVMSFEILKLGDYKIELLEDHGQITKLELLKFEREAMLLNKDLIVNQHIPSGLESRAEYMLEYKKNNKEYMLEYIVEYRQNNKENKKEYNKKYAELNKEKNNEKFTCNICDGKYTYQNKAHHLKSKKHIRLVN